MIKLFSIHIPKTAGTSFYRTLKANYPELISPSLRREHIFEMKEKGLSLKDYLGPEVEVVHGHVMASEAMDMIKNDHPKVIAFFRDPVERVISNYCYFLDLLHHPEQQQQNPQVYELNKHRKNESIYEYAEMEENRNVMHQFVQPLNAEDIYFAGLTEQYADDVQKLADLLHWQQVETPFLNSKKHLWERYIKITQDIRFFVKKQNEKDVELYESVRTLRSRQKV